MKIVSWQSVLTDHQSHTMRALQKQLDGNLLIVSGVKELDDRKSQGWLPPDIHDLKVQYLPQSGWWKEGCAVLEEHKDAIHMFNSMWGDRRFFPLLIEAQRRGLDTVLMTEPYAEVSVGYLKEGMRVAEFIKSKLRPLLYRCAGALVAKKFLAVFAISDKARAQFSNIGVPQEIIFPFGYFVPKVQLESTDLARSDRQKVHVIFIGSLIKRKGIDVLINAILQCEEECTNIQLDIYGPGDSSMMKRVSRVDYKGVIPFGEAQKVIAEYDVLVLPSLHDGWGVVVNEALLQGVPVIVSDQVGAKALIEDVAAGTVIPAMNASALADILIKISESPSLLRQWKSNAKGVQKQLSPVYAANFLCEKLYQCLKKKGVNIKC